MEEILASIRKIIADDQILPLTRPAAPRAEPAVPVVETLSEEAQPIAAAVVSDVPKAASSIHSMSDFEAAFAELRPSFSRPVVQSTAPAVEPEPVVVAPVASPVASALEPAPVAMPQPAAFPKTDPLAQAEVAAAKEEVSLVSPATGASVSSAFNALATTMFLQNTSMVEEAIRDLLRPMLKHWLDDNLPTLVERLVRAEIERVARGGR